MNSSADHAVASFACRVAEAIQYLYRCAGKYCAIEHGLRSFSVEVDVSKAHDEDDISYGDVDVRLQVLFSVSPEFPMDAPGMALIISRCRGNWQLRTETGTQSKYGWSSSNEKSVQFENVMALIDGIAGNVASLDVAFEKWIVSYMSSQSS